MFMSSWNGSSLSRGSSSSAGLIWKFFAGLIALLTPLLGITTDSLVLAQLSSKVGVMLPTERKPADVQPRNDLSNEKEIAWAGYQEVDNGNKIRVFFPSGTQDCYGYRAQVAETDDSVTIKVYEGAIPSASDHCILVGSISSLVVSLNAPLGDRKLGK
ncbi:hypothetical protein CFELI_13170 [Corynebacterium felinum]|nr:hypothetical protein CFELI_13170 [Corynebacterium felinum]